MQAEDIVKRAAPNSELFPTRQSESEGLTRLIERLQARLGADQVQRLAGVEDHRPERASRGQRADASVRGRASRAAAGARAHDARARRADADGDASCASRPVWLHPVAEPLAELRSRPLLDGRPLSLLSGPERIEAGWWDAELAERDYFIAEAADGALVWIYRARLPLSAAADERKRLVPAWPLRLRDEGAKIPSRSRARALSGALRRSRVKPRRRSESLSQRLPLTPQNSM